MFRQGDKFFGDKKPTYVEDLDSLPFPARHLFDLKKYVKNSRYFTAKQHPVASIITSRGCPHSCLFCTRINNGRRFRARSPKNVVLEIRRLRKMGFKEIQILDDTFTQDRQRVIEICDLIRNNNLDMSFCLPNGVRVDAVDEELLSRMFDAGFYAVHFGVECGDDRVLRFNRKGFSVEQARRAVRVAKKIGYQVTLFIVVGLPGSSVESEEKTLQFIKESDADFARVSVCTPYPGSPLWNMTGDSLQKVPWERYNEANVLNPIYIPDGMTKNQLSRFIPSQ
jgi:radical SAM superfamily enzyme YgiQ (UPF0313 family)